MKKIMFLLILIMSISFATLNVTIGDQGNGLIYNSNQSIVDSGDLEITYYYNMTDATPFFNETYIDAIYNGSWNVMSGENSSNPLTLYGNNSIYYKDYRVNGEDLNFVYTNGSVLERRSWMSPFSEASSGTSYWNRTGTTLEPINANDNIDIGLGDYLGQKIDLNSYWTAVSSGNAIFSIDNPDSTTDNLKNFILFRSYFPVFGYLDVFKINEQGWIGQNISYAPQEALDIHGGGIKIRADNPEIYAEGGVNDGKDLTISASDYSCFGKDTKIKTPTGFTMIQDLKVGDALTSYDLEKMKFTTSYLVSISKKKSHNHYIINGNIKVTAEHPFYTKRGLIVTAGLTPDDFLFNGVNWVQIESIERSEKGIEVYDLQTSEPNNFFANDILVHNKQMIAQDGGNLTLNAGLAYLGDNGYIKIDPSGYHPILISGAYTIPNTDGSNGQVLTTNGVGVSDWETAPTDNSSWNETYANSLYIKNGSSANLTNLYLTENLSMKDNKSFYFDTAKTTRMWYDISNTQLKVEVPRFYITGDLITSNDLGVLKNSFKVNSGGITSNLSANFTEPFTIGNYTLNNSDGSNGQVLTTNGGGYVSWSTINQDNSSWNETYANTLYINQTEESNLNVNSSVYSNSSTWWNNLLDYTNWFTKTGDNLDLNETKLNKSIEAYNYLANGSSASFVNLNVTNEEVINNNLIVDKNVTITDGFLTANSTPRIDAYRNSSQSISSSTWTTINYTNERYDVDITHSTIADNGNFTIEVAGTYLIVAKQNFFANNGGYRKLRIYKNMVTDLGFDASYNLGSSNGVHLEATTIRYFDKGDNFKVQVYQTSGSSLNAGYGTGNAYIEVYRLS